MSYFKKFTDFCAGIAAFVAGLFLLQKYMPFKPLETEPYLNWLASDSKSTEGITEAPSKLQQFFTPNLVNEFDYRLLLILIITLVISITIGIIFRKFPHVCFIASLFPIIVTTYAFAKDLLYTQEGLFIALTLLHAAGNLVECIIRDKEDGKHRLSIAAKSTSILPAALCLVMLNTWEKIPTEDIREKIPIYKELAFDMTPENIEILEKLGWIYFGIFIISIILYNVYFIDTILTTVPLVYLIYLLYGGFLTIIPAVFAVLAAVCFATHLTLCVFENNLSKKEQMEKRKEEEEKEKAEQEEAQATSD